MREPKYKVGQEVIGFYGWRGVIFNYTFRPTKKESFTYHVAFIQDKGLGPMIVEESELSPINSLQAISLQEPRIQGLEKVNVEAIELFVELYSTDLEFQRGGHNVSDLKFKRIKQLLEVLKPLFTARERYLLKNVEKISIRRPAYGDPRLNDPHMEGQKEMKEKILNSVKDNPIEKIALLNLEKETRCGSGNIKSAIEHSSNCRCEEIDKEINLLTKKEDGL